MNEKTKERLYNFLMVIGVIIILLVGVFIMIYYYKIEIQECTSDPFVYGMKEFEDNNGVEAFGFISVMNHPEISINFDSNNFTIDYLPR